MAGEGEKSGAAAANAGVKRGLPARSLKDAESNAAKVWAVARRGSAPAGAVAAALGLKAASGGGWTRNLALLRAFGFVSVSDEDISLTDLGIAVVQDADPAHRQEARRTAFFKVRAYRELVDGYDGEELPPVANIASKLRYDYGKTEEMAQRAASAFVESLTHAGLLDGTMVRKTSITPMPTDPTSASTPPVAPSGHNNLQSSEEEVDDEDVADALDAAWDADQEDDEEPQALDSANVSLSITLDLSKYRADEVIEILGALGLARRSS
jgi:hypothetical protein